jgi:hypothetical protein
MIKTETKIGRIVVVVHGTAFGNTAGTITKVLSKPSAVQDSLFKKLGVRHTSDVMHMQQLVLCEKKSGFVTNHTARYLNKPATYEHISDLTPATEEEKKLYRKSK